MLLRTRAIACSAILPRRLFSSEGGSGIFSKAKSMLFGQQQQQQQQKGADQQKQQQQQQQQPKMSFPFGGFGGGGGAGGGMPNLGALQGAMDSILKMPASTWEAPVKASRENIRRILKKEESSTDEDVKEFYAVMRQVDKRTSGPNDEPKIELPLKLSMAAKLMPAMPLMLRVMLFEAIDLTVRFVSSSHDKLDAASRKRLVTEATSIVKANTEDPANLGFKLLVFLVENKQHTRFDSALHAKVNALASYVDMAKASMSK